MGRGSANMYQTTTHTPHTDHILIHTRTHAQTPAVACRHMHKQTDRQTHTYEGVGDFLLDEERVIWNGKREYLQKRSS